MAVTKDSSRQKSLWAFKRFTYAQLGADVDSDSQEMFDIPYNAIVIGGEIVVTTAWVGPTVATLSLGDGGSATRYLSTTNLKSAARTALTLTGYKYTSHDTIDGTRNLTVAVATAGEAYIAIEYIIEGRIEENELQT